MGRGAANHSDQQFHLLAPAPAKRAKPKGALADCSDRIGDVRNQVRRCLEGVSRIEAQRLSAFRAQATREGDFFGE